MVIMLDYNTVILHLVNWLIPHAYSHHFVMGSTALKAKRLLAIQLLVLILYYYLLYYLELYVQLYMQ